MVQLIRQLHFHWWLGLALAFFLSGCGEGASNSLRPVPNAYGEINQLVIIADKDVWEGPVGDTIEFYYSSAYPILPQPEPILDLKFFSAEDLQADPLRKELRNYLIVANLSDEDSPATKLLKQDIGAEKVRQAQEDNNFSSVVGRNKWADGQMLIYLFGSSEDDLINKLKRNFPAILKKVHEADQKKIEATVYLDGENEKMNAKVQEKMGISLRVPNDYVLAIDDSDVVWMRKETPKLSSNILIHRMKYTDRAQLSKDGIKSIRDSLGRKYISSTLPNTFMRVNDEDLPLIVSETKVNGHYSLEARGIWEIENDYMGGSFISYLVHNPEREELVFLDGFIHAPGEDKRDFMQYLEFILGTVRF